MLRTILSFAVLTAAVAAAPASPISWLEYQGPAVGARAVALSSCAAAIYDEPSLIHWNPAGLSIMATPIMNVSYLHSSGLLHDPVFSGPKRVDFVSFASKGAGISWRSLARFKEGGTIGSGPDSGYSYLRYAADEFALALARWNEETGWSLGLAAKFIWARANDVEQLAPGGDWGPCTVRDDNGYGYGLDLGIQGSHQVWRVGLCAQNLLGNVYWKEYEDDKLKPHFLGGVSWGQGKNLSISAGADKFLGSEAPRLRYCLSGEYRYPVPDRGALTFRGGYSQTYRGPADGYSWSAGLGYFYRRIRIDAAGVNRRDPADGVWKWSYVGSVNLYTEQ